MDTSFGELDRLHRPFGFEFGVICSRHGRGGAQMKSTIQAPLGSTDFPELRLSAPAALALLPLRTVLLLAAQGVCALILHAGHDAEPWRHSAQWWTVWGTGADLGCLAMMVVVLHRQGFRLRDLAGGSAQGVPGTIFRGFGWYVVVMPVFLGGFALSSYVVYGGIRPHVDMAILGSRHLPIWGMVYSLTIWWPVWSTTEELTYQTFFLRRLRLAFRSPALAVLAVGFWWALQHSALPFLPDVRYVVWRFLSFLPGVIALMIVYLRTGKIRPLIVAHSLMDFTASASTLYWG